MTQLFQWLTPALDNPLTALGLLLLLAMAALLWRAAPKATQDGEGRRTFQAHFGAASWPPLLFRCVVALWFILAAFILFGIFHSISEFLGIAPPAGDDTTAKGDLRFLLTRMAALTAIFSAVVAFPFTVIRLKLSTEENARDQQRLDREYEAKLADSLDKAFEDLHAMKTSTDADGSAKTEADVVRRDLAINRLEALAPSIPSQVPLIAKVLCTYIKELSREYPAQVPPKDETAGFLRWISSLPTPRSDIENAAQILGRLALIPGMTPEKLRIDLSGANLQKVNLTRAVFEEAILSGAQLHGADISNAILQGADLCSAQMQGAHLRVTQMQGAALHDARLDWADLTNANLRGVKSRGASMRGTHFYGAQLQEAKLGVVSFSIHTQFATSDTERVALKETDLSQTNLTQEQLNSMLGDASVILPKNLNRPVHWPDANLDWDEFNSEWDLYKSNPDAYRPPQHPERAAFLASTGRKS